MQTEIKSVLELSKVVMECVDSKETNLFLFVNDWDQVSRYLKSNLQRYQGAKSLYVIDIFEIPNALTVLKSLIKDYRETVSTKAIQNYTKIPMMVRLNGCFPTTVDYMGSIWAELGL
jgi:5'(3')-deoxyribonucleotidase